MTDKPKPLTREEWSKIAGDPFNERMPPSPYDWHRIKRTLDALFEYRERTKKMYSEIEDSVVDNEADDIAHELGLE